MNTVLSIAAMNANLAVLLLQELCFISVDEFLHAHLELLHHCIAVSQFGELADHTEVSM